MYIKLTLNVTVMNDSVSRLETWSLVYICLNAWMQIEACQLPKK